MVRWSVKPVDEGIAMHWISQANIDRLKLLLETETDPTKRAMVICLLTEEETKLLKAEKKGSLSF